jgi:P pilus assembly chaperone PapD
MRRLAALLSTLAVVLAACASVGASPTAVIATASPSERRRR